MLKIFTHLGTFILAFLVFLRGCAYRRVSEDPGWPNRPWAWPNRPQIGQGTIFSLKFSKYFGKIFSDFETYFGNFSQKMVPWHHFSSKSQICLQIIFIV